MGAPKNNQVEFIAIHGYLRPSCIIETKPLMIEDDVSEENSTDDCSYSTFDLISFDEKTAPQQKSIIVAGDANYMEHYNISSPVSTFAPVPSLSHSFYSDGSLISDMTSGPFTKSVQSSESFRSLYSNHIISSAPNSIAANICLQRSNNRPDASCQSTRALSIATPTIVYSESHQKLQEIKSRLKTIGVEVSSKKSMEIRAKLRSIERHYRKKRRAFKKSRVQSTNTLVSYDSGGSPFYSSLYVYFWSPNFRVVSTMTSMIEILAQIVFFICLHTLLYMCYNMIYWISTFYVRSISIAMHSSIILFSN